MPRKTKIEDLRTRIALEEQLIRRDTKDQETFRAESQKGSKQALKILARIRMDLQDRRAALADMRLRLGVLESGGDVVTSNRRNVRKGSKRTDILDIMRANGGHATVKEIQHVFIERTGKIHHFNILRALQIHHFQKIGSAWYPPTDADASFKKNAYRRQIDEAKRQAAIKRPLVRPAPFIEC